MSYLWILIFILLIIVFIFYRGIINEKNKKQRNVKAVLSLVGKKPQASLRCDIRNTYHAKSPDGIDDITWTNLDMENMYDRMNYCLTEQGAEYLYEMLHNPVCSLERIDAVEAGISLANENKEELISLLCEYKKASVNSRVENSSKAYGKPLKEALYNTGYIIAVALMLINVALGVVAMLIVASYMIVTYFSKKAKSIYLLYQVGQIISIYNIAKSLSGFRQLEKTNNVFSRYENVDAEGVKEARRRIREVAKHAIWFDGVKGSSSGFDMILVYMKMLFHIDLIMLFHLAGNMEEYVEAARIPGRFIGFADATLSIAMWRSSINKWSYPIFCLNDDLLNESDAKIRREFHISRASHPLLDNPVPTSISVDKKGILLTGSNASGKSTFLKNIALQLVLAQTVNTVTADEVKMPFCQVISAMGVRDNLLKGDSYYMAEIKAIKRILQWDSAQINHPVVCFMDEILRGTNTKERIAGSASILRNMHGDGFVVFCATHDRELTYILDDCFENYHFTEKIKNGDICFDYELNTGRANTSNAISLLKYIGFNDKIIVEANKQLEKL